MPDGGTLTIAVENRPAPGRRWPPAAPRATTCWCRSPTPASACRRRSGERVFEPFFTTKEAGKGTGLGLSMVYGFVQQSEGHIELESAPDQGTCFRIHLPRAREAPQDARDRVPADRIEMPVFGGGRTILVVEDDPDVRQVAVATLRTLGFEVREAETGDEAAAMLRRGDAVSLLLSDITMPGSMTGVDLAHFVRRERPEIDVLLTSGYADLRARPTSSRSSTSPTGSRTSPTRCARCSTGDGFPGDIFAA